MDAEELLNQQAIYREGLRAKAELALVGEALTNLILNTQLKVMNSNPGDGINIEREIVTYQVAKGLYQTLMTSVAMGEGALETIAAMNDQGQEQ